MKREMKHIKQFENFAAALKSKINPEEDNGEGWPTTSDAIKYHVNADDDKHNVVMNVILDKTQEYVGENNIKFEWKPKGLHIDKRNKDSILYNFEFYTMDPAFKKGPMGDEGHEYRLKLIVPTDIINQLNKNEIGNDEAYKSLEGCKVEVEDCKDRQLKYFKDLDDQKKSFDKAESGGIFKRLFGK